MALPSQVREGVESRPSGSDVPSPFVSRVDGGFTLFNSAAGTGSLQHAGISVCWIERSSAWSTNERIDPVLLAHFDE